MASRKIIMALCFYLTVAVAQASSAVPSGFQAVARLQAVPSEALYALALSESALKLNQGSRPWPWTLNVAGQGYRYETRLAAWQALQGFLKTTPAKRIDVGIAQVNFGWHGHQFRSGWEALEPYKNLQVAGGLLRRCWDKKPGSWLEAAGCYHHPAGGAAAYRYQARVKQHLEQIVDGHHLPRTASLVWVTPKGEPK